MLSTQFHYFYIELTFVWILLKLKLQPVIKTQLFILKIGFEF
jgi:hypothetical protein